jgi:N-acetylmuramoyl-L-alanine amidase
MHIALDAGHNSTPADTGAIGLAFEDELTKSLAAAMAKLLTSAGHQVTDCAYPKSSSLTESLRGRVAIANAAKADLYVSLHFNKFLDKGHTTDKPKGAEVFAASELGRKVASRVLDKIVNLGFKRRSVKDGNMYVLVHTNMPAILIETCFLDSVADMKVFELCGIDKLAKAIVAGILGI